jgi:hypothetical protein
MITPDEARKDDEDRLLREEAAYAERAKKNIHSIGLRFRGARTYTLDGCLSDKYIKLVGETVCAQAKEAGWGDFEYCWYILASEINLIIRPVNTKKPWWKVW